MKTYGIFAAMVAAMALLSAGGSQVIAIDAKTGMILWRYRRQLPEDVILLHPTSRGVALYGDKVFFASGDAVLVALDARAGNEVWSTKVAENKNGYYMTLAPLAASGKVMVGASGGELGVRGFVAAYDPETGKEQWRTYTVPGQNTSKTERTTPCRSRLGNPRCKYKASNWAATGSHPSTSEGAGHPRRERLIWQFNGQREPVSQGSNPTEVNLTRPERPA